MKISNYFISLAAASALLITGCKKKDPTPTPDPEPVVVTPPPTNTVVPTNTLLPTVATLSITNITDTSAVCGGTVSSEGASAISMVGVCWDTSPAPTTLKSRTLNGAGTGNYSSSITGLVSNTKYYVRAYATNFNGTAYGNEISFTTTNPPKWNKSGVAVLNSTTLTCMNSKDGYIFAGTSTGLIFSADTGNTWGSAGLSGVQILSIRRSSSDALFAITSSGVGASNDLYRSTDNGSSWSSIKTNFPSAVTAVYEVASSGNRIVASTNNSAYYSVNDGDTWLSASSGLPAPGSFGGNGGNVSNIRAVGSDVYCFSNGWTGSYFYMQLYKYNSGSNNWTTSNSPPAGQYEYINSFEGAGGSLFASYGSKASYLSSGTWVPLNGVPQNYYQFSTNGSYISASAHGYITVSNNGGTSWNRIPNLGLPAGDNNYTYISDYYVWTLMPDGLYRFRYK